MGGEDGKELADIIQLIVIAVVVVFTIVGAIIITHQGKQTEDEEPEGEAPALPTKHSRRLTENATRTQEEQELRDRIIRKDTGFWNRGR